MFCTKCGTQNSEGAAFCVSCGNSLNTAQAQNPQPQPAMYGYGQPGAYAGYAPQKRKNGLIIGLIIGGAVLVAGIVVLVILLTGGNAANGIAGKWYDKEGYAGELDFKSDGTVEIKVMGKTIPARYMFDEESGSGTIKAMGSTFDMYLEDGVLYYNGVEYTRQYVKQIDLTDFDLSEFGLE
ncbi:MAG: zinc-ribbon domain-containing protein [Burkholderiales bacterium]